MYSTDSYASANAGTAPCALHSAKPARYAQIYSGTSPKPLIAVQNCRASVSDAGSKNGVSQNAFNVTCDIGTRVS